MASLLLGGIAAPLDRDNDLSIVPQSAFMSAKLHTRIALEDAERAIQTICSAPIELVQQLSAPERLVVAEVTRRCGVSP